MLDSKICPCCLQGLLEQKENPRVRPSLACGKCRHNFFCEVCDVICAQHLYSGYGKIYRPVPTPVGTPTRIALAHLDGRPQLVIESIE